MLVVLEMVMIMVQKIVHVVMAMVDISVAVNAQEDVWNNENSYYCFDFMSINLCLRFK